MYHHRILNWLDLEGRDWEEQYFQIIEFLSKYNVWKVGVDAGGVGDVVAQRLRILMPHIDVIDLGSSQSEQSDRWKYLRSLIDRRQVMWPAGAKVRRLKIWRRFRQEMEDLEINFKGPYVLAEAPNLKDAHDDYADSLAIGCVLTRDYGEEEASVAEVVHNPFYAHNRRRYEGR
jgi:Terminase RNaseH-like domain